MKMPLLLRKLHYWTSLGIVLPFLVISTTGLLLQVKKHVSWVQPPELRGGEGPPTVPFERVLEVVRGVPAAEVRDWSDVRRIDVRPDRGMLKVWVANGWEVQIDVVSGELLRSAYRRSDWIESLHDGSWFGSWAKYGLFLPASVALFALGVTGAYLFVLPFQRRAVRRGAARAD